MKLFVAITTSEREIYTLNSCIKSIRRAGWRKDINVYAEPGSYNIEGKAINLFIHKKKKGCLFNYDYVLREFLKTDNNIVLIVQDDLIVRKDLFKIIKDIKFMTDTGYYNILTVAEQPAIKEMMKKDGWNRAWIGIEAWGVGYIMHRQIVEKIINTDFYVKHLKGETPRKHKHGKMIDGCISQCCKLADLKMFYHNPSLSQHIGVTSTLEHNGMLTGYKFKL